MGFGFVLGRRNSCKRTGSPPCYDCLWYLKKIRLAIFSHHTTVLAPNLGPRISGGEECKGLRDCRRMEVRKQEYLYAKYRSESLDIRLASTLWPGSICWSFHLEAVFTRSARWSSPNLDDFLEMIMRLSWPNWSYAQVSFIYHLFPYSQDASTLRVTREVTLTCNAWPSKVCIQINAYGHTYHQMTKYYYLIHNYDTRKALRREICFIPQPQKIKILEDAMNMQ